MAGIRFVDIVTEEAQPPRRLAFLFGEGAPATFGDIAWHARRDNPPPYETPGNVPPPHGKPWGPWIPIPNPFNQQATNNLIPERVPMRLNQTSQTRPGPNFSEPPKTDPRSVRFTEKVGTIIGSLVRSGTIAPTEANEWRVIMIPRTTDFAGAFNGEIFIDSGTGGLYWKDLNGAVLPIA